MKKKKTYIILLVGDTACCINTGHSRYLNFAYLDTTTYVGLITHSQHFFSIFLCI